MTASRPDAFLPAPTGEPVLVAPVPVVSSDAAGSGAFRPGGATVAPSASPLAKPMGRGTLSRQLVLRVTLLVALVAVALSGLTAVAAYSILQGQIDQTLQSRSGVPDSRHGTVPDGKTNLPDRGPGDTGQQIGMLLYYSLTDYGRVLTGTSESDNLTADENALLKALPVSNTPVTVQLPNHGAYRVLVRPLSAVDLSTGASVTGTQVVGLPMSQAIRPLRDLLLAAAALTLAAIALAYVAARRVVGSSLQPLQRLANTAHQVSQLELHSGEVEVPVRVPGPDTDPRSEVGQVGLAFNHMLDNVEGALSARQRSEMKVRQFVADASHELRNPLASIRGYAELTRRERADVPPNTAHALNRIESESARMSSLVEDLLLLARLDSGPNLTMTPTHLNEIVANAVSDAQVAGPDHEWELSLPASDVVAVGDPFRLLQVISNLLANARTHTPAGTLVSTSLSAEGGFAVVRVADNGPGIPASIRDKVFERFTRADASRVRSGQGQSTGLGLAIVAAVVAAHRGTASVDSNDHGTTFSIRIPLAVAG